MKILAIKIMTPEHNDGGMNYKVISNRTNKPVNCEEFHLTENPDDRERVLLYDIDDGDINGSFNIEMTLNGKAVDGYPCTKTANGTKSGRLPLCKLRSGVITDDGWANYLYDTLIDI